MKENPSKIVKKYNVKLSGNQKCSRYGKLKRLVNEDGEAYIETPNRIHIKESTNDSFYSVELGYENRLDLISYKFYKTPFLYWAIASVNHLDNPFDVPAGVVLRIPDIASIQGIGGVI